MIGLEKTRLGIWTLLQVQMPGEPIKPAGILLIDSAEDQLYVRLLEELESKDLDFQEIWQQTATTLQQLAVDLGGIGLLHWLEDTASNIFQVGLPQTISLQSPHLTLYQLFEHHVLATLPSKKPPEFGQDALIIVRRQLPSSPTNTLQTIATLKNRNVRWAQVERFINQDPIGAASLIKLANSPLFYSAGGEVRSVKQAIVLLGVDRTIRHLTALVLKKMFVSAELHHIWNHSVKGAHIAVQLCKLCHYPNPDEVFLIALVHDIGQIVLNALGEPYRRAHRSLSDELVYSTAIERTLCGKSHAEIGADLLDAWSFPEDMVQAVRYHHTPSQKTLTLTAILYLMESWLETREDVYSPTEHAAALQILNLTNRDLKKLEESLESELVTLCFAA